MAETLDRAHLALTTDAFTSANTLAITAAGIETVTGIVVNNDASAPVDVEIVVDIGGAGTTLRNVMPKALTLSVKSGTPIPGFVVLTGDKVRARASSNSKAEIYLSRVKS